jgi:hypothetical protein
MCLLAKMYFKSDKKNYKNKFPRFEFSTLNQWFTRTIYDGRVQEYEIYADDCIKGKKTLQWQNPKTQHFECPYL